MTRSAKIGGKVSRVEMSRRNFLAGIITRLIGTGVSFASRTVFVKCLGSEYLGLGGFFGNIFSVISLCELGLGAAIAQSLYKPLAFGDKKRISAIMAYFSRVYRIVGIISFILSLAFLPFLTRFIKTTLDGGIITSAYLLFSVHSFLSYLLSPKSTLISCDQRMYIINIFRCITNIFCLFFQSAILLGTGNYLAQLTSRIVLLFLCDAFLNLYADRKYPFLKHGERVDLAYKTKIFSSARALILHKVGGVLNRSCDSLLLSMFAGLSGLGKFSNYALVIGTVTAMFDVAMNAVSASVGNLGAGEGKEKNERILRQMYFINFCLVTVGFCVIICTVTPLIELWLGREMCFSPLYMFVIAASFYFSCIRDPVQIFVSALGLFRESRLLPILRALCNIILSVYFVSILGEVGIFLGTALSTFLVPLFGEVLVLYKHGFKAKCTPLIKEMCTYISFSFGVAFLSFSLTSGLENTQSCLLLRAVFSTALPVAFIIVFYGKSEYFKGFMSTLKRAFKK